MYLGSTKDIATGNRNRTEGNGIVTCLSKNTLLVGLTGTKAENRLALIKIKWAVLVLVSVFGVGAIYGEKEKPETRWGSRLFWS